VQAPRRVAEAYAASLVKSEHPTHESGFSYSSLKSASFKPPAPRVGV
jgi:hypothetical protein